MSSLFAKITAWPTSLILLLLACAGALGTAFIAQFLYGHSPCMLCLWQRWPFGIAAALALAGLGFGGHYALRAPLLTVIALVFLANAGIAFFHTGVEQHWWAGTAGCAVTPGGTVTQSLREQLLETVTAHCDEITWTFFGFSMANWNIPFCLGLALFAALAAWRAHKDS